MLQARSCFILMLAVGATAARASDLVEVSPASDRVLVLHFKDGYVIHHRRGEARSHETVVDDPLDVETASKPASYRITSSGDRAYQDGLVPKGVGRKTKGTDFAWHIDHWAGDHAVNDTPDHTEEHWLYLYLPQPLREGQSYFVATGDLAKNGRVFPFIFSARKLRSDSVHVNLLGYAPAAPAKYAYVYGWAGDRGSLDFASSVGKRFWLVDQTTGKDAFEGRVTFRKGAANPETGNGSDTPGANFLGADVYECDFSSLTTPGRYVVAVEGVGCSFPFRVDPDVYRAAFIATARGIFQNRSGIELKKPYVDYDRPAPHHPGVTPGFHLQYSSLRYLDYGSESGTKEQIEPTLKGPLDAWGWYQDAGDWDSYSSHVRVGQELMLAYELNPKAFRDGELNIPESGNGLADILDEAAWLPRFCFRLRHELLTKKYGTGGIGLRIDGDPFGSDTKAGEIGQGSWEDVNRLWVASGEDPVSTYGYAGEAAQLAYCLHLAGKPDPQGIDWAREARESYAWAVAHTLTKDENDVRPHRIYAAAALFRLTGEKRYEARFQTDFRGGVMRGDDLYGPALYALGGLHDADRDPTLLGKVRDALLATADASHETAQRRALRWGGDFFFPMLVGQQSTPMAIDLAVGRRITADPAKARAYSADLYTTADYFLGTNALNMTWITGLGARHPNQVFHMDSWYTGDGTPHPGIVPYGPWRKQRDQGQGPWDHDWVNKTVYPPIDRWPGGERWFDNRGAPLTSEFTIHQTLAPSAAFYGVLCALVSSRS